MKLYTAVLPLLILFPFLYTGSVLDRVSERGTVKITKSAIISTVQNDLSKFTPSTKFVYNK